MKPHSFVFRLEGPGGGHLALPVLVEKVRQFNRLLRGSIERSGREGVVIEVVGLSHDSPVAVECRPMVGGKPDAGVAMHLNEMIRGIDENQTENLNDSEWSIMDEIVNFNPKNISRIEVEIANDHQKEPCVWRFDDAFREKLVRARSEGYAEISAVDGVLEEVNIHNKPYTFKTYAWAPATATVSCQFPAELLETVRGALGSWVSVFGECYYWPRATMPYKVDVQEIEVLPPSDDLPSLEDLWGISPGAVGDEAPEVVVRKLRDQWDR